MFRRSVSWDSVIGTIFFKPECPMSLNLCRQAYQRIVGKGYGLTDYFLARVGANPPAFVGYAIEQMFRRIVVFGPMWLFLGGGFYLFARLRGKNPAFLQVIFNRWLTIFIVTLVILSGVFTYLD